MRKTINLVLALVMAATLIAGTGGFAFADDGSQGKDAQGSIWTKLADFFNTTVENVKSIFGQPRSDVRKDRVEGQQRGDNRQGNNPAGDAQSGQGDQEQQAKVIARAAEILGVTNDQLATAYEAAKKSTKPDQNTSGDNRGQRPPPPSDNGTGGPGGNPPPPQGGQGKQGVQGGPGGPPPQGAKGKEPQPVRQGNTNNPPPPRPSDNMTGGPAGNPPPPPGGQGGPGREQDMSVIYSKIAETLGLSADKVTAAFEQARKELKPDNKGKQDGDRGNGNNNSGGQAGNGGGYSLDQAMSDKAQLSTIAFSGLAFITGSAGADSFFPPGKVADFFGFQYMRDVDSAGYGHNTTFLSKAANNVLKILTNDQKAKLIALAKEQEPLYVNFAYNRFPLMAAFRNNLEGKLPSGTSGLSQEAVKTYVGSLYNYDAQLSYRRAEVVGGIISSFTSDQKAYLAKMEFSNSATWMDVSEDETIKRSLTNTQFVAVMTYASELFSWYKGSVSADIYFCPERHGTYFGGFYMKDYPAMNNPDYFISTSTTGDSGQGFLDTLNESQRQIIDGIIDEQRSALKEIAEIRTTVSTELRKAMAGQSMDRDKVYSLIQRYGELDGQVSCLYAARFAEVNKTLSADQKAKLVKLRNLTVVPQGAYYFSTPINYPTLPSVDYLFGVGQAPTNSGQATAPTGFTTSTETRSAPPPNR